MKRTCSRSVAAAWWPSDEDESEGDGSVGSWPSFGDNPDLWLDSGFEL